MRRPLALLVAVLAAALALPALPAAAAVAYGVHYVKSVGGALIRVEVQRDTRFDTEKQPVILTYSPYNTLNEDGAGRTAGDDVASRYNPRGYARAVADVIGTRGSTGCWDYGGAAETQSGVDVVRFLAGEIPDVDGNYLGWSNGNVGMAGVSYEGTTANMVAATGVEALKGIIPIAAISRWYGYAFEDGVRYFLNSRRATDEGFDTPLLFDAGFSDTVLTDPNDPMFDDVIAARASDPECGAVEHTQHGYDRDPDYTDFWKERDYLQPAREGRYRAAVLVVHGWQDYNVKQEEGTDLYEALTVDDPETAEVEGVPFKMLWMTQAAHADGSGPGYQALVDRFWERTLKGVDNGIEDEPRVTTNGRVAANTVGEPGKALDNWAKEADWPPPQTRDLELYLGRKFDTIPDVPSVGPVGTTGEYGWLALEETNSGAGWTHANPGTVSEELTLHDPLNRKVAEPNGQPVRGHGYYSLFHESQQLAQDLRLAGSARFETYVNVPVAGQHLTPILVEVLPTGRLSLVERGFLNLDYRDGLDKADPETGWLRASVEFLPQDYTFTKGSRIGLILQGSNTVWAVPGNPGAISYAMGKVAGVAEHGARLVLPVSNMSSPGKVFDGGNGVSEVYRR